MSVTTAERTITPEAVEFNGKHLEAAFTHRAEHHKRRILEKFGDGDKLPNLPEGTLDVTVLESEKRFQKAYDLLRREEPAEIPEFDGTLSRDYIMTMADNLAWKGIENSITTAHLDEINKALRLGRGDIPQLKKRAKELKPIVVEDNHFYRDFFDSDAAASMEIDSPNIMKRFLKRASLTGNGEDSVQRVARGVSLEIATARYLNQLLREDTEGALVAFGSPDEDLNGGDIVVVRGDQILYIDLKNGHDKETETEGTAHRLVLRPESHEPVAEDSFRLTDPTLKNQLREAIVAIR